MKAMLFALTFMIASLTATHQANAHSGGTNSAGCHAGSQPYHCH